MGGGGGGGGGGSFCMIQWRKSCLKQIIFCMTEMRRQTQAHNLNTQCIYYAHVHGAIVQCITT